MANTYTCVHFDVVFSTKHREPWIRPCLEERVWAYLGGIARTNRWTPLQIGGVDDHVHLLLGLPPTVALSKAMQLLKGGSSAWIRQTLPGTRGFGWQDGYAAFSVSRSHLEAVSAYIRRQREHHRVTSFQEELRRLLERHRIAYDERYLWD